MCHVQPGVVNKEINFYIVRESTDGPNCSISLVLNKNGDI